MAKHVLFFILLPFLMACNLYALANVTSNNQNIIVPIEQWYQNLGKSKQTKLHFYVQDILRGENATMWPVAESKITSTSPSFFGTTNVGDILLTAGPNLDSPRVGRLQGTFVFADLHEMALFMSATIVFTHGDFIGSTITVMGRIPMSAQEREISIVGGTGVFSMARGIASSNIHTPLDQGMNYQVLEVTLYIVTY